MGVSDSWVIIHGHIAMVLAWEGDKVMNDYLQPNGLVGQKQ